MLKKNGTTKKYITSVIDDKEWTSSVIGPGNLKIKMYSLLILCRVHGKYKFQLEITIIKIVSIKLKFPIIYVKSTNCWVKRFFHNIQTTPYIDMIL